MTGGGKTGLVDFGALVEDGEQAQSSVLVRNLGSLLAMTAGDCNAEQLETYDNVLLQLIALVDTHVRAELARILAPLTSGPIGTVRQLASDEIAVAAPILEQSPLLDDIDLKRLSETQSNDHLLAITRRRHLAESVTDSIVVRGNAVVLESLILNAGARISQFGFSELLARVDANSAGGKALRDRPDFPAELIQNLTDMAAERVRDAVAAGAVPGLDDTLDEAASIVRSHLINEAAEVYYDYESAEAEICALAESGTLTVDTAQEFAIRGEFARLVWAHAILSEIDFAEALAHLTTDTPGTFIICARANGYSDGLVRHAMNCGPWRELLSAESRRQGLANFRRMSRHVAFRMLEAIRPQRTG